MNHFLLVSVFILGLVLKVAGAAPMPVSGAPVYGPDLVARAPAPEIALSAKEYDAEAARIVSGPARGAPPVAYAATEETTAEYSTTVRHEEPWNRISLSPNVGGIFYSGEWNSHVSNNYGTWGLNFEVPISAYFSTELEGMYGNYTVSYGSPGVLPPGIAYAHNYNLWGIGGSGKFYVLSPGIFRPYIGAGLSGLYYEGMSKGPAAPYLYYNQWVGAGQAFVGSDIGISESISVGARVGYQLPIFNKPTTIYNNAFTYPTFEDASLMNTGFWKANANLKVKF